MGQPKVIVALVAALVLALGAFIVVGPAAGLLVLVLGGAGVFLLMRQEGATIERPRRGRDAEFLDADVEDRPTRRRSAEPLSTWAPEAPEDETLSPWSQDADDAEPLSAWSPGADGPEALSLDPWSPETTEAEAEPSPSLQTWESEPLTTWDTAPVDHRAEEAVVDEAEEIAFASSLISTPINEDVASADDIMAASEATELHIPEEDGEDSELAKLLAKVQARLAAYE